MKKVFLHPKPIRIWHWINAAVVVFLILTGIQLRFPVVSIFSYGRAATLHKGVGFVLAASFLFWLVYYIVTGGITKHYMIRRKDFKAIMRQALYYSFAMFKGERNPFVPSLEERFNALQKIAYSSLMLVLSPIVIVTGILFSDISYFLNIINTIGGVRVLDAIHVAAGYAFLLYLIVHLYMATLGHRVSSHVKAMITGYGEEPND